MCTKSCRPCIMFGSFDTAKSSDVLFWIITRRLYEIRFQLNQKIERLEQSTGGTCCTVNLFFSDTSRLNILPKNLRSMAAHSQPLNRCSMPVYCSQNLKAFKKYLALVTHPLQSNLISKNDVDMFTLFTISHIFSGL
jgi:hypothetical protein